MKKGVTKGEDKGIKEECIERMNVLVLKEKGKE